MLAADWKMSRKILTIQTIFLSSKFVRNKSVHFLQDVPLGDRDDCVFRAMVLLQLASMAKVFLSANLTSKKQLWLFKRELGKDDVDIADVIDILAADLDVILYRNPVLPRLRSTTLPVSIPAEIHMSLPTPEHVFFIQSMQNPPPVDAQPVVHLADDVLVANDVLPAPMREAVQVQMQQPLQRHPQQRQTSQGPRQSQRLRERVGRTATRKSPAPPVRSDFRCLSVRPKLCFHVQTNSADVHSHQSCVLM